VNVNVPKQIINKIRLCVNSAEKLSEIKTKPLIKSTAKLNKSKKGIK